MPAAAERATSAAGAADFANSARIRASATGTDAGYTKETAAAESAKVDACTFFLGTPNGLSRIKRENEVVQANFILALGVMFEARYAAEWWDDFSQMDRAEFEEIARDLVGPEGRLAMLRRIVQDDGSAES